MIVTPLFDYQFRIILIGDSMVGKSSLVRYFVEGSVDGVCDPTVGVDFFARVVELRDGIRIKLQLWDTAGQEKFRSITRSYYRNSAAALIVFDLTNRDSFQNMYEWYEEARCNMVSEDACFSLVGHKADMEAERKVSEREAKSLANELGMQYFETSALTGKDVDACFTDIAERVYYLLIAGRFTDLSQHGEWDGVRAGYGSYSQSQSGDYGSFKVNTSKTSGASGGCC